MMDAANAQWREFNNLGVEEVRKQLAAQIYGENKAAQAREWLAHQESERTFAISREALEASEQAVNEAREANSLAREPNALSRNANEEASKANGVAREANELARSAKLGVRSIAATRQPHSAAR